ncbi:hypothetical protein [Salinibacter altiplanensis]|uniref:hypothetical protein n=1 Tax=Salinibacter altiplanensis TaxID=1803181 RepID=UPI001F2A64AF|nr:hypothetical protein [Salinibacter altiplanensis]
MPNLVAWGLGADVSVVAGAKIPVVEHLISMGITLFVAGALEEFGWRGFAPLYVYMPEVVAFSVVLGWLYNASGGALPVVMVTHAVHNRPDILGAPGEMPVLAESVACDGIFYAIVIAIVAWQVGARTLSGDGTLPEVPGAAGAPAAASQTPPASQ